MELIKNMAGLQSGSYEPDCKPAFSFLGSGIGIRRREFERFITELEKLPEAVSEFDETLWGSLVDYVTVGKDKTMTFTLIGGTEVKA